MKARKFPSFIDAFSNLAILKGAPPSFALWTALWMLGAAVERRVYTFTKGEPLYPNLFVFLVGPPGFGKGLALEPAHRIIGTLGKNWIGASSMTSASLADGLKAGHRVIIDQKTQATTDYWSLNVCSPELQVLLPEHDTQMLGKLTYLYDGKGYSESRRGNKEENSFDLPRCLLSFIGGTTPVQIFSTFPETAFQTGFFSRTIMVWGELSGDGGDLFTDGLDESAVVNLEKDLANDLRIINQMSGRFSWQDEAKDLINGFNREKRPYGGDPVPSHPRLLHYCTRRTQHLIKLMMLRAVDQNTLTLTGDIYRWAYDTLISVEAIMPEIFREQNQGGETQTVNDLHHELAVIYAKTGKPIPKSIVYQVFGSRVQAFKIEALITMAVTGNWLERKTVTGVGTVFIPKGSLPSDEERRMKR